jgi:hypothetical protein
VNGKVNEINCIAERIKVMIGQSKVNIDAEVRHVKEELE